MDFFFLILWLYVYVLRTGIITEPQQWPTPQPGQHQTISPLWAQGSHPVSHRHYIRFVTSWAMAGTLGLQILSQKLGDGGTEAAYHLPTIVSLLQMKTSLTRIRYLRFEWCHRENKLTDQTWSESKCPPICIPQSEGSPTLQWADGQLRCTCTWPEF